MGEVLAIRSNEIDYIFLEPLPLRAFQTAPGIIGILVVHQQHGQQKSAILQL